MNSGKVPYLWEPKQPNGCFNIKRSLNILPSDGIVVRLRQQQYGVDRN